MLSPFIFRDYYRPWRHLESLARDLGSTIKTDKDKFQINLDVQHFAPDEITVKTTDGFVIIEANHEEKKDEHGFVSRSFVRRYALPEGAESDNVVSTLSSDGILTITAPRKEVDAKTDKDKFQINLDVQHFAPDEITVKTTDGFVIIEANHEEKKDEHGFVSRSFVRRYALPEGAESDNVVSTLSSDGILTITAPRKEVDAKGERVVPITQTGPVRKEAKEDTSSSSETCSKPS